MGWFKHAIKSVSHAIKHPMKSLEGEIHREGHQFGSAFNVGSWMRSIGLGPPKPPAPDHSTADALLALGQQQAAQQAAQQQAIITQQQQEAAAQKQAQQQQELARQAALKEQEQARQDAMKRKRASSLIATSPTGLPDSLLGSAASLYGKATLGA
ncbi:TPA: hypothetical protein G5T75_004207 [Salmonella enterica]|uniref:Uncharacterized protein n=1 Tax=Salmonella enterica TaxID=28901 RepID=A0A754B6I1_SALER|nr:hypothetical protein [Salmonella enterica]EDU1195060.1 hypothetical protein [Salmonella enterica subsp. enterica serovar Heidelberg str. CFSAN000576]HAF8580242.1 hypothetical protein [Salmonella enterica]